MNLFITGYTGFIGSNFLKKVLETLAPDDKVTVLSRTYREPRDPRVHPIASGFNTPEKYEKELLECDYVFHIGALATYGNKLPYDEMNYEPVKIFLNILSKSNRIKNFVFLSTIGTLDRAGNDECQKPLNAQSRPSPMSEYGKSKLKAERAIQGQSKVPFTIIRPTWVYGSGMRTQSHIFSLAGLAHRKHPIVHFRFPGKVSLIHVDDLCAALVHCLHNPTVLGKIYMGVTESRSIGDLLGDLYEAHYGKRPAQVPVPRFQTILGKVHSALPLTASNLFLDYLYAEDDNFRKDFNLVSTQPFELGRKDVTSEVSGAYWAVTGANSGIGLALTNRLLKEGEAVIAIDRALDALHANEGRLVMIKADLSSGEEIQKIAHEVGRYRLKAWINNAGVGQRGTVAEVSESRIEEIFQTNVMAPMRLVKVLLPQLRKDGATIVNMSSSIAWNPLPHMSIYSASKAALANWSESLAYELKQTNRVLTLYPSGTRTNFQKNSGVKVMNDGKDLLDADIVAKKIIASVRKGKETPILGFKMSVLLVVSKFLPRGPRRELWGKLFNSLR